MESNGKVLAILNKDSHDVIDAISSTYTIVFSDKDSVSDIDGYDAVVIGYDKAISGVLSVERQNTGLSIPSQVPIIMALDGQPDSRHIACIGDTVDEIIFPPYIPELVSHRIDTAIKSKRSRTFHDIEKILGALPSGMFLKDTDGRYLFSTTTTAHFDTKGDPNWSVYGRTDLEARIDKQNAMRATESDREIIKTGIGTDYVIEENSAGKQEFLELMKRPVFDEDGNVDGIIALVHDVTESELLKMELRRIAHTDELTGLGNHRAFDEKIEALKDEDVWPLGVIAADCDNLKTINDTFGHIVGDEYIRMTSAIFKSCLPDGADAFRTGGDEFVAFLPQTDIDGCFDIVDSMIEQNDMVVIRGFHLSVSYGVSVANSSDEDVLEAVRRADSGMYDSKAARVKARPEVHLKQRSQVVNEEDSSPDETAAEE